jgi:hypothetical protein
MWEVGLRSRRVWATRRSSQRNHVRRGSGRLVKQSKQLMPTFKKMRNAWISRFGRHRRDKACCTGMPAGADSKSLRMKWRIEDRSIRGTLASIEAIDCKTNAAPNSAGA